jgi:hypothetical protein
VWWPCGCVDVEGDKTNFGSNWVGNSVTTGGGVCMDDGLKVTVSEQLVAAAATASYWLRLHVHDVYGEIKLEIAAHPLFGKPWTQICLHRRPIF